MNETKRMTSIAKRINRSAVIRLFWALFWADALLVALTLAGWCYAAESAAMETWTPMLSRTFSFDESLPVWLRLDTMTYTFSHISCGEITVAPGRFFVIARELFCVLLAFEGLTLLGEFMTGRRRARRLLRPLEDMARTAQQLSTARFDEEKFHNLEDAIARISPATPDARLYTGDRDLQGLESAVNSLLKRMHESYQQQSRFVSDASHELRTPIAVIQGYANMLDRWGKDDEKILTESIAAIKSESEHMKKLVEQLLFLARGDSGRTKLNFEQVNLTELVREVLEESEMIDNRHAWRLREQPGVMAYGDAAMLKQTARVLVDNAIKYTPDRAMITLSVGYDENSVPFFAVQDNGIGISPEDAPHVFDRFFRSDPARGRQTGGTGLGLSIAKWIIDRHGGYFTVLSREEVGTRITVSLPVAAPAEKEEQQA